MQKKWMVYTKRADFHALSERFGLDPVVMRVMRNRDLTTEQEIKSFLYGDLSSIPDGTLLPDAEKAADILLKRISSGAHIRVVGDYDIDGVCATYILLTGLRCVREALGALPKAAGAKDESLKCVMDHAIPDRIRDGYGINAKIVDQAREDGVDTILTCDNGIAAIEELAYAKACGMTVIVTDHHDIRTTEKSSGDHSQAPSIEEYGEQAECLPPADAIVNPKLRASRYPGRDICGAVVAWKLVGILYEKAGIAREKWLALTEFAAVATVGDVMPLRGENRVIVKKGLEMLTAGAKNTGLRSLIAACGLDGKKLSAYHIGFVIGPCINAGGRLESAETALQLFLCTSETQADMLSGHLKLLNDERKSMTEQGVEEACRQAESLYTEDKVLVLYVPQLHESLAGIVAGRIRERFGKPCFVLADGENCVKGSGRSIETYHMFQGLCGAADLLLKFGGHPMAAGLSLERERIDDFRHRLNEQAALTEEDFVRTIWIDAVMPFSYIGERLVSDLSVLEPFGNGNEKPVFAARGVCFEGLTVLGKNRNVLRCRAVDTNGGIVTALLFGEADRMQEELSEGTFDVLYDPRINEFNGRKSVQIVISDYR